MADLRDIISCQLSIYGDDNFLILSEKIKQAAAQKNMKSQLLIGASNGL